MSVTLTQTLTVDQLEALVEKAGGAGQVLRVLAGELDLQLLPTVAATAIERFVTTPTGATFEERIAQGRFGWRNPDLTEERFRVTPDQCGAREQKVFHFARSISSEDAIAEIRAHGFEPAGIGDILAFGQCYPDEQRRHPIAGLGSVVDIDGKLSLPLLWYDGARRTLDLIWYDGDWHPNYRFLGARSHCAP